MKISMAMAATALLNDTFPNPFAFLLALAAWALPPVVIVWVVVRLARKRDVPWPSALAAAAIFVGLLILAILADAQFPRVKPLETVIHFVADCLLPPALMLLAPFGALDAPLSRPGTTQSATVHLAL